MSFSSHVFLIRHYCRALQAPSHQRPLVAGTSDEPLEHCVQIGFFFSTDAIAADLAARHGTKVKSLDQLVDSQVIRQVRLVAENQERNTFKSRLLKEQLQLFTSNWQSLPVCRIYNESTNVASASLPLRAVKTLTRSRSRLGNIAPTSIETLAALPSPSCGVTSARGGLRMKG